MCACRRVLLRRTAARRDVDCYPKCSTFLDAIRRAMRHGVQSAVLAFLHDATRAQDFVLSKVAAIVEPRAGMIFEYFA